MTNSIRLCLCLHNHQPVGNFDGVFEQAYRDSYLPFLDLFETFQLPIALHTSGPLLEWLDQHHPEYLDRVASLVAAGRIEVIGGPYFEPILTMIPPRDRVGQIRRYRERLESRLGGEVRGMWMPERVWEQSLVSDIVAADINYTILDDYHFHSAGLSGELTGYYLTEDNGRLLSVFPGSERLRYTIPFAHPDETINHLRYLAEQHPDAIAVFGDDGEKFGTWPETKMHVYDNGWLHQFFSRLHDERDWIHVCTLAAAADEVAPQGTIYLPDASYREMCEWSLPAERQVEYEDVVHQLQNQDIWQRLKPFLRGGSWRNFRVKYPEVNEMYARMIGLSQRLAEAQAAGTNDLLESAQFELYQAQCNCSYWHGAFGGIYLPHLRNAVYHHLIRTDNLLEQSAGRGDPWIDAEIGDFNLDVRQEVKLVNDQLIAWIAPAEGGTMYELDVRSIAHNLLATMTRRPETYHRKVIAGQSVGDQVASIHDRVVFKQEGLDSRVQYDEAPRKSLCDHFFNLEAGLEDVRDGRAEQRGDFLRGVYEARVRRNPDRIQVQLVRNGQVGSHRIRVTKGVTGEAGSSKLEIAYLLEDLPPHEPLHFAVEFNMAGLPAGADDRFFYQGTQEPLGRLESQLDLRQTTELGMIDRWLGIDLRLEANRPTDWWTFPIETVSQSEGGFELVHQSCAVLPHWIVQGDSQGRWSVVLEFHVQTAASPVFKPHTPRASVRMSS